MIVVKDGKAQAQIVIAAKAAAVEMRAAKELRKYIRKISGVSLDIGLVPSRDKRSIYIGRTGPGKELDLSQAVLGEDGYVVKTVGNDLVLAGAKPYSSLYAVYHLLERYCNCGFFEDGDRWPREKTITLPTINDVEKPFFKYRRFMMAGHEMYGTRWWDFGEWKKHLDWGAKKRFNVLDQQEQFVEGFVKLRIWRRLGVAIEPTEWQREQLKLRKKVFAYARLLGMKIQLSCGFYESQGARKPGNYAWVSALQFDEFIKRSPTPVPTLSNSWLGVPFPWIDPRTEFGRNVMRIGMEEMIRLFGTDHLYAIRQPSEDAFIGLGEESQRQVTWAIIVDMRKVIREVDPQARIEGGWPWQFLSPQAYEAQKDAIREALKGGNTWISSVGIEPGRQGQERPHLRDNCYEGAPFWTGVIGMGAGTVNFFGDLAGTIRELQIMVNNPKGVAQCEGYAVWPEALRRNIMAVDLYMQLGWGDPRRMTLADFLRRYADGRYGKKFGPLLLPALERLANSVYSFNANNCGDIPLYRMIAAAGDTVELNNRNLIKFMPEVHAALEIMASQSKAMSRDRLYRFDMVEVGRNYLGMKITDYIVKAREAFGRKDLKALRFWTERAEKGLTFQAKLVSAHPWFRLRTEEEWASKWSEFFPGASNAYCNRIGRTTLFTRENWCLDYWGDDLAELILYYYKPRVMAHLGEMSSILERGSDAEWREALGMTSEKDATVPRGDNYWGRRLIGPTMKHENDIILKFVDEGYPRDEVKYYDGPIAPLVAELMRNFPLKEVVG